MNAEQQLAAAAQMFGAMFGKPHGVVLELRHASKAPPQEHEASPPAAVGGGATVSALSGQDVLEVKFRTPEGEQTTWVPNQGYNPENPALMFMAAIGHKPSDFSDSQTLDVRDEQITVPLAYDKSEGEYGIHGSVLERGQQALIEASWNPWTEEMVDIGQDEDDDSDDSGGSDDGMEIEVK